MILLRFHFLLLRWHGWFLGCISKMCLHLTSVRISNKCDIIGNTDDEGFYRACCRVTCRKKKTKKRKKKEQEQNTRAVEEALEEKAGERTSQFGLHHSSSNLQSYSQRAHFKMLTIQSDFFHFGKKKPRTPNVPMARTKWSPTVLVLQMGSQSAVWKFVGLREDDGSQKLATRKECFDLIAAPQGNSASLIVSIVTTEHFDVAIKTHGSLDMLTHLCKESLSSWPQKKGLFILILCAFKKHRQPGLMCQSCTKHCYVSINAVNICSKRKKKKIVILIFSRTVEPNCQPPPQLHLSLDSGSTSSRPPPGPATWCSVTPRGIGSPLQRPRGRVSVYWRGIGRSRLPSAAFSLSPGRLSCLAVGVHSHRAIKRQELQAIIDISLTSKQAAGCRGACRRAGGAGSPTLSTAASKHFNVAQVQSAPRTAAPARTRWPGFPRQEAQKSRCVL